ncbi:LemA family protein [Pontiellaceae bacterium B12219]|nr:LemA family protein [Pontiellaceae bacterium B12219]
MKAVWIGIGGFVALIVVMFMMFININNGIIDLDENVNQSWANVETVLQRRFDLIPNVVNTVKGFADHEKELLTEVTRLRSQWGEAKASGNTDQSVKTAGMLESALGRLMVVVEKYPDIKSNQNFLALQEELSGTENRISVERRRYNEAVAAYNKKIRKYPGSFVAGIKGYEKKTPFEAAQGAETAPVVAF